MKKYLLILVCLGLLVGCLSEQLKEGANVKYLTKQEAPSECTLLGSVTFDTFESAISSGDAITRLRNKTGKLGGNLLVVDIIETKYNQAGSYYLGEGRAYKCPGQL